ncbi:MAG: membrane dipeptidase [Candidatus Parcubacteria bacterium]|nr:membrane dipeptidase [Burkholderiales bacterium]
MKRRQFLAAAGAVGLCPGLSFGQAGIARYSDMHAHLGFKPEQGLRAQMEKGGMLLVAEKITPDGPLIQRLKNKLGITREARPGEMRRNYELALERRKARMRQENIAAISSLPALDNALAERAPGIILAAEGADFLEGDLRYLDKVRADGLVHLQLVHYYGLSGIGDISTESPQHKGLSAFGRDLVRACNRLGMLVDVAHCSNQAMEQVLEFAARPVVYSHGHVSAGLPSHEHNGSVARAVHLPVARKIAERGGVIGLWPDWYTYANLALLADGIARTAEQLGAAHVGIGSDMHGLVRTVMPTYAEFAALEGELSRRGMRAPEIEGILGGNYLRVLREAMKT